MKLINLIEQELEMLENTFNETKTKSDKNVLTETQYLSLMEEILSKIGERKDVDTINLDESEFLLDIIKNEPLRKNRWISKVIFPNKIDNNYNDLKVFFRSFKVDDIVSDNIIFQKFKDNLFNGIDVDLIFLSPENKEILTYVVNIDKVTKFGYNEISYDNSDLLELEINFKVNDLNIGISI